MPDNLSQRIVDFIGGMPHCHHEQREHTWVTRRLTDGTVIAAATDEGDQAEGIVVMEWAGDPSRCTRVLGATIAELEIAEGIRRWVATGEMKEFKTAYTDMAHHFEIKTGATIACGFDPDQERAMELALAVRKFGVSAVLALVKAKLGSL